MIKQFIFIVIINIFLIFFVTADDISIVMLQNRLDKIDNLYVHFTQQINIHYVDKNIVEEYRGEFWVKRPNLFYWHLMFPEENFLISDGITLWFYVPIIRQATAYSVKRCFDNILWTLFFGNKESWKNFDIHQKGDFFFIKPVYNDLNMKKYKIEITKQGIIKQFSIIESHGIYINYFLSKQNNDRIDNSQFYFSVPEDVQLDDQRK